MAISFMTPPVPSVEVKPPKPLAFRVQDLNSANFSLLPAPLCFRYLTDPEGLVGLSALGRLGFGVSSLGFRAPEAPAWGRALVDAWEA